MNGMDTQTDADVDPTGYREKLIHLDSDLSTDNIQSLKFLCLNLIPTSKLERVSQATDLFDFLEHKQCLAPGNLYFLAECLNKISRCDLSSYLLDDILLDMAIKETGSRISPYRSFLFAVSEDIGSEEVNKCVFYDGSFPKAKKKLINSAIDLFIYLEQCNKINCNSLDYLEEVFTSIDRMDLVQAVKENKARVSELKSSTSNKFQNQHTSTSNHQGPATKSSNQQSIDSKVKLSEKFEAMNIDEKTDNIRQEPTIKACTLESIGLSLPVLLHVAHEISINVNSMNKFGLNLNLTKGDIDQLSEEHRQRPDQMVLTMINMWSNKCFESKQQMQVELVSALSESGFPNMAVYIDALFKNSGSESKEVQEAIPELAQSEQNQSISAEHENISVQIREARVLNPGEDRVIEDRLMEDRNEVSAGPQVETYSMKRIPRGICVIINNEIFEKNEQDHLAKKVPNRQGSSIDKAKLQQTFETLGFEVHPYDNVVSTEMVRLLTHYAINIDHSNYDCFACCIMSHGTRDNLYGADCRQVPIKHLTDPLKTLSCTSLADKPKLFFIQACQGQDKQRGLDIQRDSVPLGDLDEDAPSRGEVIPNEADFLLGMATIPGFVSYRSKSQGSWYISKLCEVLNQYGYNWDILNLLTQVNNEVGKANAEMEGGRYKQCPAPFYTLRKRLVFERPPAIM